jgi:hypothetical protein
MPVVKIKNKYVDTKDILEICEVEKEPLTTNYRFNVRLITGYCIWVSKVDEKATGIAQKALAKIWSQGKEIVEI